MVDHARAARMAKRIQTIVATALEREIRDPRVEYITITDARVTGDLHDATVYYTVRGKTIDEEPDVQAASAALEKVKGHLRRIVGQQLSVRFTPTLSFAFDNVPETSSYMEQLLEKARKRDEELAKLKETATPAGDPSPYKTMEEE
ncbi:30S ribosome-binding factor RbfA [Corynebacterium sp. sy017]|uniref:30S ribosome-binding factor RbfA n=1 Tax=unclassified Corynebacterium TaxID=2624378 RepID=UPI0011872BDE|nr:MULTISPECIES: 30S ribosome-binding factor RbfA [unclassified Corynebacterium]MBP3087825.1 30S ribosome-binding factor RbfA [Corynebacterium sp. sy017]QDZ42795.1 30S ribosome-binding factor RbfA [Corynebacterium sp. sy039]TSD92369.1 30S ribosome-binding factor RbfA [Corynebacterium sp. SY003]